MNNQPRRGGRVAYPARGCRTDCCCVFLPNPRDPVHVGPHPCCLFFPESEPGGAGRGVGPTVCKRPAAQLIRILEDAAGRDVQRGARPAGWSGWIAAGAAAPSSAPPVSRRPRRKSLVSSRASSSGPWRGVARCGAGLTSPAVFLRPPTVLPYDERRPGRGGGTIRTKRGNGTERRGGTVKGG